jgi:DNA polymerase III delta' subunit
MGPLRTRGQARAVAAVRSLARTGLPHAILLSGPSGAGKTTLAGDLAAIVLCTADPDSRPCGSCRSCRLVREAHHPDVHRVAPDGPGGQIRVDQVRSLSSALALHGIEGPRRIAIVEHADRMNEDAQHVLLKTLEEPPSAVTIVLCADDDDRLLPTVRSRVARIRLGAAGNREVEALLAELGLAEPPESGRIARAANGLPGRAIAYARSPEALAERSEVARLLIDLLSMPRVKRLRTASGLLAAAAAAAGALDGTRGAGVAGRTIGTGDGVTERDGRAAPSKVPPSERRRALAWLIALWTDVSRDLAAALLGEPRRLRDPGLLDDLVGVTGRIALDELVAFLARLAVTSRRLDANVSPELALDGLVLAWPRLRDAA